MDREDHDHDPSDTDRAGNDALSDNADQQVAQVAKKAKSFPQTPGVYLFKDRAGRVLYIGKAKNLRSRVASYFLKAAADDPRTRHLVREIRDIDYLDAASEVDALLMEARLIKDVQPKYNTELKDDKTFPYLQITTHEDFPRVEMTREPRDRGVKLYGPFAAAGSLRGAVQVLQKVFMFRTCSLDIDASDERWKWFRPCLLASIDQCTAPCNLRITREEYRRDIKRLRLFLDGGRKRLLGEIRRDMQQASAAMEYEKAARLRDELEMLESLDDRGELETHAQPEVFYVDPKKGLTGLEKVLHLKERPRTIEGVDVAHLGGDETVASLVRFLDGLPFKPGYRRYRIRGVEGIDDYASIGEAISRRFRPGEGQPVESPDILLIDGGLGQLRAGLRALEMIGVQLPMVVALAKREETLFVMGRDEPLRLSRHAYALRLLQYVRDEAHRFAQHYHHILRKKST
ncbi:MAG: UvrB/UvrC motif-containing protein, partial [Pirellulales bacterium]